MAQGQVTQQQIYQSWMANGATPQLAQTMAAIAMAESSGFTAATNHFQGNTYMGLYQIGQFWGVDPGKIRSDDLNYQTQQAMKVLNQQGLKAWETYTTGAYQKFLGQNSDTALALYHANLTGASALADIKAKAASGVPLDSFESLAAGGGLTSNKYTPSSASVLSSQDGSTPAQTVVDQGPNAADAPGGLTSLGDTNPTAAPSGASGGAAADAPVGMDQNSFLNG